MASDVLYWLSVAMVAAGFLFWKTPFAYVGDAGIAVLGASAWLHSDGTLDRTWGVGLWVTAALCTLLTARMRRKGRGDACEIGK